MHSHVHFEKRLFWCKKGAGRASERAAGRDRLPSAVPLAARGGRGSSYYQAAFARVLKIEATGPRQVRLSSADTYTPLHRLPPLLFFFFTKLPGQQKKTSDLHNPTIDTDFLRVELPCKDGDEGGSRNKNQHSAQTAPPAAHVCGFLRRLRRSGVSTPDDFYCFFSFKAARETCAS